MQEREEKEQDIGNLFENIMKENFPKLGEGNRHVHPGSTENPNKMDAQRLTPKTHHN